MLKRKSWYYTPAELADELGVNVDEIYRKVTQGLPVMRDSQNNLWIHGPEVAHWLRSFESKWRATETRPLAAGEAYCLRCRRAVQIVNPTRVQRGKFTTITGTCSICGAPVNRGTKSL